MQYLVDDSPLNKDEDSISIVDSEVHGSLRVRVGDAREKFSSRIYRHIEVSTHDDFTGKPVWEPLPDDLREEMLKWAVDLIVRILRSHPAATEEAINTVLDKEEDDLPF